MTCSAITFRGWVCGLPALGRDSRGRWVCARHTPPELTGYLDDLATLAAFARLHVLMGHPWPRVACTTCDAVDRRRRELAASCPVG